MEKPFDGSTMIVCSLHCLCSRDSTPADASAPQYGYQCRRGWLRQRSVATTRRKRVERFEEISATVPAVPGHASRNPRFSPENSRGGESPEYQLSGGGLPTGHPDALPADNRRRPVVDCEILMNLEER
jgi:hypothetical protein